MKTLVNVKTEIAKLASAAALSLDFTAYKDLSDLLKDMNEGKKEAIDRGFNIYNILVKGSK
jgi:hypothetical protein